MQEPLSTSEWMRWLESDREWKSQAMGHLINHGERLAQLESYKTDAGRAEQAAMSTKKWAVIGGTVAALINGFLLAFGGTAK